MPRAALNGTVVWVLLLTLVVPAFAQPQSTLELLRRIGSKSVDERQRATETLATLLQDPDVAIRRQTARAIMLVNSEARPNVLGYKRDCCLTPGLVPFLVNALKDTDREVRASAANALVLIGPEASSAVHAFLDAVRVAQLPVDPDGQSSSGLGTIANELDVLEALDIKAFGPGNRTVVKELEPFFVNWSLNSGVFNLIQTP